GGGRASRPPIATGAVASTTSASAPWAPASPRRRNPLARARDGNRYADRIRLAGRDSHALFTQGREDARARISARTVLCRASMALDLSTVSLMPTSQLGD